MIHGVERHDALHIGRRQLERLGDLDHPFLTHPAALVLHHPERRQERRHLRGIALENFIELATTRASCRKHELVRLVLMSHVAVDGVSRRMQIAGFALDLGTEVLWCALFHAAVILWAKGPEDPLAFTTWPAIIGRSLP